MKKFLSYVILLIITSLVINSNVFASCADYTSKHECISNEYDSCIWNETEHGNYCGTDKLQYVQCGGAADIPSQVPELTSFAVNFLKIITPIILIVTSIITLVKSLMASKEDEIKKATSALKRKVIAAVLVFVVIYIVQFVIMKVADSSESDDISACLSCFINNDCQNNLYYKVATGSKYYCIYFNSTNKTNQLCDYIKNQNDKDAILNDNFEFSCSGDYYDDGSPESIIVDGKCQKLVNTGKYIAVYGKKQYIYKIGNKNYYWNKKDSRYYELADNINFIDENYMGKVDEIDLAISCNNQYFDNGYQPKTIIYKGECRELAKSGDEIYVVRDGYAKWQNVWYVWDVWDYTDQYYYWDGGAKTYEVIPKEVVDKFAYNPAGNGYIATRYHLGVLNESCYYDGWIDDGYIPKAVILPKKSGINVCVELEKTDEKVIVTAIDRKTQEKIQKEQYVWKTTFEGVEQKWIWSDVENEWKKKN